MGNDRSRRLVSDGPLPRSIWSQCHHKAVLRARCRGHNSPSVRSRRAREMRHERGLLAAGSLVPRSSAQTPISRHSGDTIMTRRHAALGLLMLLTLAFTPLAAQTTAGDLIWQPGEAVASGPLTYIDFTRPVTMDGTITHATLRWISNAPCSE